MPGPLPSQDVYKRQVASVPPQGGRKHPHQELLQIDTTNILFICGGAFDGLEKIIESRIGQKSIGFNAEIGNGQKEDIGSLLQQVLPEDFVKFGLIPEFIGRVPVNVSLNPLDREALVRILKEPKSACLLYTSGSGRHRRLRNLTCLCRSP